MTLLAIADDLTGALEAGAKFAALGVASVVRTQPAASSDCPVVVIDTETRHVSEESARRALLAAEGSGSPVIYKKTDSVLRGNIGAELSALAEAFPDHSITYMPAYPALGRTVKNGHLYIDGVLVHQTAFAQDPLNPVGNSSIRSLLGKDLACVICDAETDLEIERAVADVLAASHDCILAGPASVAAELAKQLPMPRQRPEPWPAVRNCVIVNGSWHAASHRQIHYAEQNGCVSPQERASWRVVPPAALPGSDMRAADGVMIFGGDTAFCFWQSIGCPDLRPIGEIVSGVPVSRISGRDLVLISKAGSFGGEDLICEVKRKLNVCE